MSTKNEDMTHTYHNRPTCFCSQCEEEYDYKEMADENTCQECVYQTREYKKVDLKRLLESMPDEDIDEVINEMETQLYDEDFYFERTEGMCSIDLIFNNK